MDADRASSVRRVPNIDFVGVDDGVGTHTGAVAGPSRAWLDTCLPAVIANVPSGGERFSVDKHPRGSMHSAWLSALAFLVVSFAIGGSMLVASRIVRVRARSDSLLKHRTYECGEEPSGTAWMQFHARYYVVALFFVLFDVEAAFLFPWAVVLRSQGAGAFAAAVMFVLVLMLGWLYAIRKEALEWQ